MLAHILVIINHKNQIHVNFLIKLKKGLSTDLADRTVKKNKLNCSLMLRIINFKNPLLNSRSYLTLVKLNASRGYRKLYFTNSYQLANSSRHVSNSNALLKSSATNALLKSSLQALIQALVKALFDN